ncbi:MAG: hypothetical protein RLY71_3837, partial [Pseudomonadota bacterium]
ALAGRPTVNLFDVVPTFTRAKLFRGDRMTCACCGQRCTEHTLEEAAMPLLYLPYVPSRFEDFLLEGRHIRAPLPSHPSPPSATATALQGAVARTVPLALAAELVGTLVSAKKSPGSCRGSKPHCCRRARLLLREEKQGSRSRGGWLRGAR